MLTLFHVTVMIKNILIVSFSVILLLGCQSQQDPKQEIFARIDDEVLTVEEFIYTYTPQIRFIKNPFDTEMLNYHGGRMIRNVLFAQYQEEFGTYDPLILADEIAEAERKAVIDEMIRLMIDDSLETLSEEEVRDAYRKSLEYREVRHLFSPDSVTIHTWYRQIQSGQESFHSLSKEAFQDTFLANHGGYLGFVTFGDMVPEFEEKVFLTEPGKVSRPFKTPFGWHILSVESIQTDMLPSEDDFQMNRDRIKNKIRRVKKEKFLSGFYTSLVEKRKVKPDRGGVQALSYLIMSSRITGKSLANNIQAYPSDALFEEVLNKSQDIWDKPVVYVDDDFLSLIDILPLLKRVPLALLYRNPSQAVLFAVRDELVYQMGLERGLDKHETVLMKKNVRRKDWLSRQFVSALTDTMSIHYPPNLNEDEKNRYAREVQNALIHQTYLDLRQNARVWTDMDKVYAHYDNIK
ncbi:MAG: hypothetical protein PWP06_454 [Candidatus Marinimicrobia bacterium]|nr:hypothetical protein [Candidatus Neomarinimicrobiota bacterium]